MSPFPIHNISTPSPHSRAEAMSEEETTRWEVEKKRTSQQEATDMTCSLQRSSSEWKMCFLPPRHMPLPQANSKLCSAELLPTVQHSDGKAQPYTVRHLSQSSAILATAIQLFSFGKRKACMDLYKALFREILFPREGKIPCSYFAQINNKSFSDYFPDSWCGTVCLHYLHHMFNSQNKSCAETWKVHKKQNKLGRN